MSSVNIKTRIQLKNNTAAYWNELTDFVPLQGEMIIYNDTPPRMKIGDGVTKLQDLVFASALVDSALSSTSDNAIANKAVYSAVYATSGVSAGNYGPTGNVSPGSSGTFSVPYFSVNAQGKVTAAATRTITMPAATSVSLNGASTTSASFYAPTAAGTSGYVLVSSGSGAPSWKAASTLATGSASSVAWANVTSKPSYYDAKAITSISRSGTTFTATHLDGTTSTFTQQDNNTTYSFSNKAATLAWNTTTTIATVGGVDITVKMPANPDTNTTYTLSGLGGVGTVSASGTAPLTLSASKSGTTVTITGSVAAASTSANGYVSTGTQSFAGAKTFTGAIAITNTTASTSTTTGALKVSGGVGVAGALRAASVYGAVWNDYAEYRAQEQPIQPGLVAYCDDDGVLKPTTDFLSRFEGVVSDTFGFAIGETEAHKTPIAVSGRVLVYTYEDRSKYHNGDIVCAGPEGKVCKMTREQAMTYPERIVGIVSEIPDYDVWGEGNVEVNNRIWIRIK